MVRHADRQREGQKKEQIKAHGQKYSQSESEREEGGKKQILNRIIRMRGERCAFIFGAIFFPFCRGR